MPERFDLYLAGCTAVPLACYLKALAVLRLVAEQRDRQARGYWVDGGFHLVSNLDTAALERFFLDEYQPTPIVAPWAGGCGFFDKDNKEAITALEKSTAPRLAAYREVIALVRGILLQKGQKSKPEKDQKPELISLYRAQFPDILLPWLDAALVLTSESLQFPPLLGTGGNDGRLDFSQNFMQRVLDVIPVAIEAEPAAKKGKKKRKSGTDTAASSGWLRQALWGQEGASLIPAAIGQFHPGGTGGPNASQGLEGGSLVNPWDFVLMMEGTLMFAGAAARRLGAETGERAAFPFTVSTVSPAGTGTMSEAETGAARAELWLPLWDAAATCAEISHMFAEGRAQVGRRQARSGVDFARAIAGLGIDRGIAAFQRFGLLNRSGKAYLATPLGRLSVAYHPEVSLFEHLDGWLERYRRLGGSGQEGPARFRQAYRAIEAAIFAYCERGGASRLQEVLIALGQAEQALAVSPKTQENIRPLSLTSHWIEPCNDQTPEFRIAAALASIVDAQIGPLRAQLEPVDWTKRTIQWNGNSAGVVWGGSDLYGNLAAILQRRCLEGQMGKSLDRDTDGKSNEQPPLLPLEGRCPVHLSDIQLLLDDVLDEARIASLLWGLATVPWKSVGYKYPQQASGNWRRLSRSYALLKLVFLPRPFQRSRHADPVAILPEMAIMNLLRACRLEEAIKVACRRLSASGLTPLGYREGRSSEFYCAEHDIRRLAAALLIPIDNPEKLGELVLQPQLATVLT